MAWEENDHLYLNETMHIAGVKCHRQESKLRVFGNWLCYLETIVVSLQWVINLDVTWTAKHCWTLKDNKEEII